MCCVDSECGEEWVSWGGSIMFWEVSSWGFGVRVELD